MVVVLTVGESQLLWFGIDRALLHIELDEGGLRLSYFVVSTVLIASWLLSLAAFDSRDAKWMGIGPTEY